MGQYAKEVLCPIDDYIRVISSSIDQIKDALNEDNKKEFLEDKAISLGGKNASLS